MGKPPRPSSEASPKAPRWVSFDCYGTLIDWESGIRRAFRELIRVREEEEAELFLAWEKIQWEKIQEPYVPYAEILRSSFRQAAEEFGYRYASYAGEAFVDSLARWEPFPDVRSVLNSLSHRHRLAIISNVDRDLLGQTLRHFPVRFDALITAEDARAYKPNPEIFNHALGLLGCPPEQVVHVAFGVGYDLQPAHSAGLRVVHLNRKPSPGPGISDVPLEATIKTLEELLHLW